MIITKLTWAGVCITEGEKSILIDPIGSVQHFVDDPLTMKPGTPREEFLPLDTCANVSAVLVTHFHPDHFDPPSIISAFGSNVQVFMPKESVRAAVQAGLENVTGVQVGDEYEIDGFKIAATHSVDGFGSPQVSWVVSTSSGNVAHFGDTLWHGFWWKVARNYGPLDVVCLPVNGPVLSIPGLPRQSTIPAAMTPEEAVEAAALLGAKHMLPIHYHTFHNPPYYVETPNVLDRVHRRAEELSVNVLPLQPGESHKVGM